MVMIDLGRGRLKNVRFCFRLFQVGDICSRRDKAQKGSPGSDRLGWAIVIVPRRLFPSHGLPIIGYTEVSHLWAFDSL